LDFQFLITDMTAMRSNSAPYGSENGLTTEELNMLEKLIAVCGEAVIAGNEILNKDTASIH
jgi:hypothetical protein